MEIKTTKSIDIEKLNGLFKSVGWTIRAEERWKEVLEKSKYVISVWELNDIVGFGRVLDDSDFAFFLDVIVDKNHQSKGIGKKIINGLIDCVKDKKYYKIQLFAGDEGSNDHLYKFYGELGFERVSNGMELKKYQYMG